MFAGNQDIKSNTDLSYMIGHGMCSVSSLEYPLSIHEDDYFADEYAPIFLRMTDEYYQLLELGSPSSFSGVDCKNVRSTAQK